MAVTIKWPNTVNNKILNYKPQPHKWAIIEDATDTGTSQRRLRSSFPIVHHNFTLKFSANELSDFNDFVNSSLVGGTLPFLFSFPNVLGGAQKAVRFVLEEGEAYGFVHWDKNKAFVSIQLEEYAGRAYSINWPHVK